MITPFDASITSRYALSLYTLTNDQQKAADVDTNNNATVYDAVLYAQYSVGLINSFTAGMWLISPLSNTYNLISNLMDQNYKLTAVGDPSGNWTAPPSGGPRLGISFPVDIQNQSIIKIPVHANEPFSSYLVDKVNISIYNMLGSLVMTLVDEIQES